MKRLTLIALCLLLCSFSALAGGGEGRRCLRWNLDWGYGIDIYRYWDHIFTDSEVGYLVRDTDDRFGARPNAYFTAGAGIEPLPWLTLTVFSGIMGIDKGRTVLPVGVQATAVPKGNATGGFLLTAGGGYGVNLDLSSPGAAFIMAGAGWRTALSSQWDLDLILRARVCRDAPPIWDEYEHNYVSKSNIRKNVVICAGLEIGIALSF